MICPNDLTAGLEEAFTRIQRERMTGMPMLNPALSVQAVGFREWHGHCLGVLITPWFMNLMLLPFDGDEWAGQPSGTKVTHTFPSGRYEFMLGEEEAIGRYQMCSLFSPVFDFEGQAAAVATAEAVMAALMDGANLSDVSTRENEIRNIWHDEEMEKESATFPQAADPRPTLSERIEQPMSRRDLLRGRIPGAKGP